MIWLLLGLLALLALLWSARAFSQAEVKTIKALFGWIGALGGLSLGALLLLTGRGAAAISGLIFFGPLIYGWWQESKRPSVPPRSRPGPMTREEAWAVLGLQPGASDAEIRAAYLRLMRAAHPDNGGSDWLAARINQARDILLGR